MRRSGFKPSIVIACRRWWRAYGCLRGLFLWLRGPERVLSAHHVRVPDQTILRDRGEGTRSLDILGENFGGALKSLSHHPQGLRWEVSEVWEDRRQIRSSHTKPRSECGGV